MQKSIQVYLNIDSGCCIKSKGEWINKLLQKHFFLYSAYFIQIKRYFCATY